MIFNSYDLGRENKFKESYKERNLYYKLFAGYLFNEYIPNNEMGKAFLQMLKVRIEEEEELYCQKEKWCEHIGYLLEDGEQQKLTVSFDYHLWQERKKGDRGELADILIVGSKTFIAIEVKYLEDFKVQKDVIENSKRISRYSQMKNKQGLQVLLIKQSKLNSIKNKRNHRGSQYTVLKTKLDQEIKNPFAMITWEDILGIIEKQGGNEGQQVASYLKRALGY